MLHFFRLMALVSLCTLSLGCTPAPHELSPPSPSLASYPLQTCVPASERGGREVGCYIVGAQTLGSMGEGPVFWHLSRYTTRSAAEAVREPVGTVVESFGQVWLFTIGPAGSWPAAGERVAEIGPLEVRDGRSYAASYMEAVFLPGMQTVVHTHPGPEAWYTLSGEMCLETPAGSMIGRAGGPPVIVPEGPPMQLTATGTEVRRALVLILHDASHPAGFPNTDWQPKGLCRP